MTKTRIFLSLVVAATFAACIFLARLDLTAMPFEPDTASYLFQAKLFAEGKLYAAAPPDFGFSASPHINIHDGKWYSRYPYANAMFLAPGVLLGAPIVIPALLTALTLVFLYLFVRELFGDPRVAILAVAIAAVSPATIGLGSTLLSQPVSRFLLAVFLWGLVKALRRHGAAYAMVSGGALGLAFNARPLTAVAFAAAGAIVALAVLIKTDNKVALLKSLPVFLLPLGVMLGTTLWWNHALTGSALTMTHGAVQPHDKPGFGFRGEGYPQQRDDLGYFTPAQAMDRFWRFSLPCYLYNLLGWGRYTPAAVASLSRYSDWAGAGILVKGADGGDWASLRIWGTHDGNAIVQLWSRERPESIRIDVPLDQRSYRPGEVTLTLRLARAGDRFRGEFVLPIDNRPAAVGEFALTLKSPLQVGPFVARGGVGTATAYFDGFHGSGITDARFARLSDQWRWRGTPAAWSVRDGNLAITPRRNSHLSSVDSSAGVYQEVADGDFAVETTVRLNWRKPFLVDWLWTAPLMLTALLMILPLFQRRTLAPALGCFTIVCAGFIAQFFYYSDHATWGFTPLNVSYHAESLMLGAIPLAAGGLVQVHDALRSAGSKFLQIAAVMLLVALMINTIESHRRYSLVYRTWLPVYQHLPRVVAESGIDNAVVYIQGGRNAPVGEYPFVPLRHARVVYYRLGPWPAFGLHGEDWRAVHARYFSDRVPYTLGWHGDKIGDRVDARPELVLLAP